jgi:hypothetical protein
VLLRNDDDMNGGLRVQIVEGRQFIRFMHKLGIDLMPIGTGGAGKYAYF